MNYTEETPLFFTSEDKQMIEQLFSSDELKRTMLNSKNKKVFQVKFKQTIFKYNKAIKKLKNVQDNNNRHITQDLINRFEEERNFMLQTFGFLFKSGKFAK